MTAPIRSALVTGATGFIGSALSRRLAQGGARTFCLVRAGSPRSARLSGVPGVALVEVASLSLAELARALRDVRAEVVFHLASYGVAPSERDPEQMIEVNVELLTRLLLVTSGWPLQRFVHIGSCSEYAPAEAPARIAESHPIRPISLYGAAKAAAHLYGNALALQLGVPFFTLRPFGVYGVGEAPHRLIPHLIDRLRRGEEPSLTAGEQARDLTYVDDLVEALITAARAPRLAAYEAYNVSSDEPLCIRAVAEAVARIAGKPGAALGLGRRPYRSDEAMWVVGDSQRFRQASGWRPRIGLDEGIGRMVAQAPLEAEA